MRHAINCRIVHPDPGIALCFVRGGPCACARCAQVLAHAMAEKWSPALEDPEAETRLRIHNVCRDSVILLVLRDSIGDSTVMTMVHRVLVTFAGLSCAH